jgi:hypothetical protein
VLGTLGTLAATTFSCQDFEVTCDLAKPTDIVFMDCPFPAFTKLIPAPGTKNPESSKAANTYGVDEDNEDVGLQTRIVNVTRKLINQGTTVMLCNFANPGIVRAYSALLWDDTGIPQKFRRWFTYTYCSPARASEAYLLTILRDAACGGSVSGSTAVGPLGNLHSNCRFSPTIYTVGVGFIEGAA